MAVVTRYGVASTGYNTLNGSGSATDSPSAGHAPAPKGGYFDNEAWWRHDLSLAADAVISAASMGIAESGPSHTNPTTWYIYDTSSQGGGAIGTLYSGGWTTSPSVSTSRIDAYKTGSIWIKLTNALVGSGSSSTDTTTITVTSTYISVTYSRPPSAPGAFTSHTNGQTVSGTISLAWGAATDPEGDTITYSLERDGTVIYAGTTASFSYNTNLTTNGSHAFRVRAIDTSGSNTYSGYNTTINLTVNNGQTLSPSGIASAYASGAVTIGRGSMTVTPAISTTYTSDRFARANSNLSGSNTDLGLGGAAKTWLAKSTTPGNDATNLQIVGGVLKRTVAEGVSAYFDVAGQTRVRIGAKIVTMPDAGDTFQLWARAVVPAGGGTPSDGVRFTMASDGSASVQRIVATGQFTVFAASIGTFAAGDTITLLVDDNNVTLYKNGVQVGTAAHEHTGLAALTGIILRVNGTAGTALAVDDFLVETPTTAGIPTAEAVPSPVLQISITLQPGGVASAEAVPNPQIYQAFLVSSVGAIASTEAVPAPVIGIGSLTLQVEPFSGSGLATFRDGGDSGLAGSTIWNNNNCAITFSAAAQRTGANSILIASTAAGDYFGVLQAAYRIPVKPGERVSVQGWVKSRDVARNARIGIRWWNAVPASIGDSTPAFAATSLSAWGEMEHSAVAPAGAAWASPRLETQGAAAGAEGTYWEDVFAYNLDAGMGTPALAMSIATQPGGVASAEAIAAPVLALSIRLDVSGIASAEAVPDPIINRTITVGPSGVGTLEAAGLPTIYAVIRPAPPSIDSAEVVPAPVVIPGPVWVLPNGIASAEAFGYGTVPVPGIPWLTDQGFHLSLLVAPPYSLVVNENAGTIVVLNGQHPIDIVEGD